MLSGSVGVSEQPVTIKDIEINKILIDLLKLTRIIFKPKGSVFYFGRYYTIIFYENH